MMDTTLSQASTARTIRPALTLLLLPRCWAARAVSCNLAAQLGSRTNRCA